MILRPPPFPSLGVDCITTLDAVRCKGLVGAGMRFACRYLGSLTVAERDVILASGMGISPVTYGRTSWDGLSSGAGIVDGGVDLAHLTDAGIPSGATVWIDLEGVPSSTSAADVEAWVDARSYRLKKAGYDVGLYIGAAPGLSGDQAYSLPNVDRYWRSLSRVPEPTCGFSLLQLFPTTMIAGTSVDVDCVQQDWHGRLPIMVWADGFARESPTEPRRPSSGTIPAVR